MPSRQITIGPFSSVYISDYGSRGLFTTVAEEGTGPGALNDSVPQKYITSIDAYVPAGFRRITVNLTFHYNPGNETLFQMTKGLSVNNTDINSGSDFAEYELLLIAGDGLQKTSIYIPKCCTTKNLNLIRDKNAATTCPVTFEVTKRNHRKRPYYFGTADELSARLGDRAPF